MRRLNVRFTQIEECIAKSLFAVSQLPRTPPLRKGEPLLLQLVLEDARRLGKVDSRIEFALIFDRVVEDPTGEISRRHWPDAGKVWPYILECSETVPTLPFSLERLGLSRDYGGQANPQYIEEVDARRIEPMLKDGISAEDFWSVTSVDGLLRTIRNYDAILRLQPPREPVSVREHRRRPSDPWLSDALKRLYNHRCQVCVHDFEPRYGAAYADTRIISERKDGRPPASREIVVLCPNHRAIVGETGAKFDPRAFAFEYPNGLVEKLLLRDHLLAL